MNWGLKLDVAGDPCSGVDIELQPIDNAQACFGGAGSQGYITFNLKNTGTAEVSGLSIIMSGEQGSQTHDINDLDLPSKSAFSMTGKDISYDFTKNGKIGLVQFIPRTKDEKQTYICTRKSVEADTLKIC